MDQSTSNLIDRLLAEIEELKGVETRVQIIELHFVNAMAMLDEVIPEHKTEEFGILMTSFLKTSSEAGSPLMEHLEDMKAALDEATSAAG